jgi:hypothetical protein
MPKNYFSARTQESIQAQLISLNKLIAFFRKECDVYAYLAYGTLLGAIRDKNVIPYDTDYDIAYLSKFHTIPEIQTELQNICKILIKNNLLAKVFINGEGIINPKEKDLHDGVALIDVFTSWIINDKFYLAPNIYGQVEGRAIVPFKYTEMRGLNFVVPKHSKILLRKLYGSGWRTPNDTKQRMNENG